MDRLTGLQYILSLHELCRFMSTERPGVATNGEVRRWLQSRVVIVNGEPLDASELVDFPIMSLGLFPKSAKRRTTLVWRYETRRTDNRAGVLDVS